TPGVHIESAGERFKPLGEVRMGACAFLGRTQKGKSHQPVKVDSFDRFVSLFGNDGGVTTRSVRGFFENGGTEAYVLNVTPADGAPISPDDFIGTKGSVLRGLRALEDLDDLDLIAAPDLMDCYKKE